MPPRTPTGHGLGWRRDQLDPRDIPFTAAYTTVMNLPPTASVLPLMPPVYDQGQLGSCTGNGWAAAVDAVRKKQGLPFVSPSRLFIYYGERVIEHTVHEDAGAEIRDGIKSLARDGVCPEATWPYDIARFATKPSAEAYREARGDLALRYLAVQQTLPQLCGALAQGFPVVYGFLVYEAYEELTAARPVVPMPTLGEEPLGGHCNVLVGYRTDAAGQVQFQSRNSWSAAWGEDGYCWFPAAYLLNPQLANDFWTLELVRATA